MKEYIIKFYWRVRSGSFQRIELLYRLFFDYSNRRFAKADRLLRRRFGQRAAWRVYLTFLKSVQKGRLTKATYLPSGLPSELPSTLPSESLQEVPAPYGETPLITMRRIVEQFGINPEHSFLEVGSGIGRVSLWLATQIGCRVKAIEQVPLFIETARLASIEGGIRENELQWIEGDFLQVPLKELDWEELDWIYFYGLGMPESLYIEFCKKLAALKHPARVITIGGPLSEYHPLFITLQKIPVVFAWGWSTAYLNVCREPCQSSE